MFSRARERVRATTAEDHKLKSASVVNDNCNPAGWKMKRVQAKRVEHKGRASEESDNEET